MSTARTLLLTAAAASLALATPAQAQSSLLSGRVVDEATSLPIAGAMVQLPQRERRVRTDSTGAFYAGPLEAGPIVVMVRAVGYMPVTTSFRLVPRDSLVAQFQLRASSPTLAAVRAEARRPTGLSWMYDARLREFEGRREVGMGRFLDWQFFDQNIGLNMPGLLSRNVLGLKVDQTTGIAYSVRGRRPCPVQVIVNELPVPSRPPFDFNQLQAADIIGVEFYTVATTPARFSRSGNRAGGSHCGTVVVWTKY